VDARIGLFVASFVLGGACWAAAKQMLEASDGQERIDILTVFSSHMARAYSPAAAEWVLNNWKLVEEQHIQLIKLLKF